MNLTKRKPIATKEETAELEALQGRWAKWSERRQRYHGDRIALDMDRARRAFIASPSEETEGELLRCSDVTHLGKQYRAIREACDEGLQQLACKLREIVVPMLKRAVERLQDDLAKAEATESKERQRIHEAGGYFARSPKSDCTSLELAISHLQQEIHQLKALNTVREPTAWLRILAKY